MNYSDTKTLSIIKKMMASQIGDKSKWKSMAKKLDSKDGLGPDDEAYFASMVRIYGESGVSRRSRIYHTKLSDMDKKPPCASCGKESLFYCNMNDHYYCTEHLTGHDENES